MSDVMVCEKNKSDLFTQLVAIVAIIASSAAAIFQVKTSMDISQKLASRDIQVELRMRRVDAYISLVGTGIFSYPTAMKASSNWDKFQTDLGQEFAAVRMLGTLDVKENAYKMWLLLQRNAGDERVSVEEYDKLAPVLLESLMQSSLIDE